jgi:hypothetical protein
MQKNNYILKIHMDEKEAETFAKLTPLINLSINESEANMVSRLLGYQSARELVLRGFKKNPYLQNAFLAIAFLYITKEDKVTFDDFWSRLVFTDKDVERRVKEAFDINIDAVKGLSELQLELMWMLDTEKDEWDDTVREN